MTNAAVSASAIDLHGISRATFDLIVSAEGTSPAWYSKHLRGATWPGTQSGFAQTPLHDGAPDQSKDRYRAAAMPSSYVRLSRSIDFGLETRIWNKARSPAYFAARRVFSRPASNILPDRSRTSHSQPRLWRSVKTTSNIVGSA